MLRPIIDITDMPKKNRSLALIELYQLDNATTTTKTTHASHKLNETLKELATVKAKIDYAAAQVMPIIHEYHDTSTNVWPMQPPRQDTSMPTHLKPPISRAGLAKLIN
jgi:hypothetical protein